ncbi:MSMEG_0570 family nitrogen starvation response protein [Agrobacterium sp. a22-2]|uniref:MSMEG_0570 family nitrogen starvation response protein n=1 Tax=Agrobacterium sp. a22-2 TaxID=2283840 RepID=UPI001447B9B1|nr:MSMEG_0570 family nitrogen starvation response protein [Agrobacterium sp. a22-2]NKN37461.1 MSMEG_0570 family nitrogen starvation response protein [Agrobacterium sp. a22-2]
MPEMRFVVTWPGGRDEECYSPSLIIKDFFAEGQSYPLADFLDRSRQAFTIASDRVEAKYGFPCSLARGQLARIETAASGFRDRQAATVLMKTFLA